MLFYLSTFQEFAAGKLQIFKLSAILSGYVQKIETNKIGVTFSKFNLKFLNFQFFETEQSSLVFVSAAHAVSLLDPEICQKADKYGEKIAIL